MLILIGESGSGKSTILNELEKRGFEKAIDYTTRKRREKESENSDLKFLSKEEFEQMWKQGKLLQRAEYNEEFYGIATDSLKENVACIQIVDSIKDVKQKAKELGKENEKMLTFYIHVPAEERTKRMLKRGDSISAIQNRLLIDAEKFKKVQEVADYMIENEDLEQAVKEIEEKYRS